MLGVENVSVGYAGVPAVVDATVEVPDGGVLAVLGPSGCGKSTLLRAVAGLEPVTAGRICWDGRDLAGVPTHKRGFALMFQDGQLFTHLSVARNVGYALRIRRARHVDERVEELLALVGLEGYGGRLPGTLSGGERQRVALARSLAVEPRLLMLDEPLSALDTGMRERLAADLRAILTKAGTTAVLVTHDQEEAFAVADRIAVMREGRIVQQGKVGDVWAAPADPDTALFLGYARVLTGSAADHLVPGAASVAVRRSALTVSETGSLVGRVVSVQATPEQVRLVVRVDGIGEVDAVAPLGSHLGPGDDVRLAVDHSRVARIPDDGRTALP